MIKFKINELGAELSSLIYNEREYLWQGDPNYWKRRAPILFPIVGRLADDTLRVDDNHYPMSQHGFARDTRFLNLPLRQSLLGDRFELLPANQGMVRFAINPSVTHDNYPYRFDLGVTYMPQGNTLSCDWEVANLSDCAMHFQIGAHPAFLLPDYDPADDIHGYLRFYDAQDNVVSPMVVNHLVDGLRHSYGDPRTLVNDEALLPLTRSTFADDAILLEGQQVASVSLLDKERCLVVKVTCPQADAFGLWAPNIPGCPFVCIEPWCGIADRYDFQGDISERECNHSLQSGERFLFSYLIQL